MTHQEAVINIHKDKGCKVAPRCLQCPLPMCRYDVEEWHRLQQEQERRQREVRNAAVLRDIAAGFGPQQAADRNGVSVRTLHRITAGQRQAAGKVAVSVGA